jgi:uncharacterized repeat protein (TIGR04052 family)
VIKSLSNQYIVKTLKQRFIVRCFTWPSILLILAACSKAPSTPNILKLDFFPYYGDQALNCQLQFEVQGERWQAQTIGLYISDLEVATQHQSIKTQLQENVWQTKESGLLWFNSQVLTENTTATTPSSNNRYCKGNDENIGEQDTRANTSLLVELPSELDLNDDIPQLKVSFTIGLPFDTNHANPLLQPSPINTPDMFWSWRNGHKFVRVDMRNNDNSWSLHLGSVGCSSASSLRAPDNACQQANRFSYTIAGNKPLLRLNRQGATLHTQDIKLDIGAIIQGITLSQETSCMFDYSEQSQCSQITQNLSANTVFEVINE